MNKTIRRLGALTALTILALTGTYGSAKAIGLDEHGSSAPVKKVAPAANCDVGSYALIAKWDFQTPHTYAFTGTCTVDVAPENEPALVQRVKVQIMGEWHPKLNRASEVVKIYHPDRVVSFTTWATCKADPFNPITNATCTDPGYGSNDFAPFLRKEDVPFAKRRVKEGVKVTDRKQLQLVGNLTTMQSPSQNADLGVAFKIPFAGGPSTCPMDVDFGDGKKQRVYKTSFADSHGGWHKYDKPGTYTIRAKSLPGCNGESAMKVTVK